jgi:hypothetical protein
LLALRAEFLTLLSHARNPNSYHSRLSTTLRTYKPVEFPCILP